MLTRLKLISDFVSNMGVRYLVFRISYMLKVKSGILKSKFPNHFEPFELPSLDAWKKNSPPFFFDGKNIIGLIRKPDPILKQIYEDIRKGVFVFFSKEKINLGINYDWITNPETNYKYDISKHWTQIQDLSKEAGDIKYVWEKARFSFLYDVIRYDYHFDEDCSEFVIGQILSFIEKNPINYGPNYKCSQEISLRVLNWTFALYYYKDSITLNEDTFKVIMQSIYGQLHHIYHNINFSRISVRNNHAITETLTLYLSGLLFPFLPNVKLWSTKGEKWFEQEISYQIYKDGTFLQFSMNYHRVVVQLLTWAIRLSEINDKNLSDTVYNRARKSLEFLDTSMDPITGMLPNYGPNDGALFFKFTNDDFRVFTSQLNDLRMLVNKTITNEHESRYWYGYNKAVDLVNDDRKGLYSFPIGGYYIIQEGSVKTFVRCGAYRDRPTHADNLHIDIWAYGKNIIWDTGSYKYNTDSFTDIYFKGSEGHNSVTFVGENQMLKGSRFIWYYWVKKAKAKLYIEKKNTVFKGEINAFRHIGKKITHSREISKEVDNDIWRVNDLVKGYKDKELIVYWHINPEIENKLNIECTDIFGKKLLPIIEDKFYSGYYGVKELSRRISFITDTNGFITTITLKK